MKHRNTRYNCSRGAMANTRPCRGRNPGSTPGAGVILKYQENKEIYEKTKNSNIIH